MQFNKIHIKDKLFFLPANINSLTAKQYRLLVQVAHQNDSSKAKLLLFFALLDNPKNLKNIWWFRWFLLKNEYIFPILGIFFPKFIKIEKLDIESLYDAIDHCTGFFFNDESPLVVNPHKKIYQFGMLKPAIARADTLADFSLLEFSEAEEAYSDYLNKQPEALTKIIQLLYTGVGNNTFDELTRMAILHYYENVRGFVFSSFPLTFPKSEGSGGSTDIAEAYRHTIHILANNDPTKYQSVGNTALWDCLFAHEMKLKALKELKTQTPTP